MKPPVKGQSYFIREKYDRGGLKRLVILDVTSKCVRFQHVMNDGSPVVDPEPMPKYRNPAASFFVTVPIREWNRIRRFWQLTKPDWAKKL